MFTHALTHSLTRGCRTTCESRHHEVPPKALTKSGLKLDWQENNPGTRPRWFKEFPSSLTSYAKTDGKNSVARNATVVVCGSHCLSPRICRSHLSIFWPQASEADATRALLGKKTARHNIRREGGTAERAHRCHDVFGPGTQVKEDICWTILGDDEGRWGSTIPLLRNGICRAPLLVGSSLLRFLLCSLLSDTAGDGHFHALTEELIQ